MDSAHERAMALAGAARLGSLLRAAWRGMAVDGTGDLVTALLDSARALTAGDVPYAVIGGFAVGMHATPRATIGVDIAVPVRVLARADLIASKERAANDPARRRSKAMQDLVDIERLRGDDPDPEEGW